MYNAVEPSVFGDTYRGVVSPNVFHTHPYSTRYHGMNLTVPRFPAPFVENPYAVPSFMGIGVSPDGLGNVAESAGLACFAVGALKGIVTGAVIGGAIGYAAKNEPLKGAAYGAGIGGLVIGGILGAMCAAVGSIADQGVAIVQK